MSDDGDFVEMAAQGGVTLVGNFLNRGLGFLFVAIVTRFVRPEVYGTFTLSLSIVLFAKSFVSLNLYRAVDYFLPQHLDDGVYDKAKSTLLNVVAIAGVLSVFGAAAIYALMPQLVQLFDEPLLVISLPILSLLLPVHVGQQILLSSFNSVGNFRYRVYVKDLVGPVLRVTVATALLTAGVGLVALSVGYLVGVVVAVVLGGILLFRDAQWLRTADFVSVSRRDLLSYSLPLVMAGVMYSLVSRIDYFMIGFLDDSAGVAYYRVAYLLAANVMIVLSAVTPVFKPMVAENRGDDEHIQKRYQFVTRLIVLVTIPIGTTLVVAPELYLSVLFDPSYAVAGTTLVVLTLGYVLNGLFGPVGTLLEGTGYTRLTMVNIVVLLVTNAVVNYVLIPRIGILGAAIGTTSALLVTDVVSLLEVYYLRRFTPASLDIVKVSICAVPVVVLAAAFVRVSPNGILLAVSLPLLIVGAYILTLRVANAFTESDRAIARQIDRRIGYPLVQSLVTG